MSSVFGVNSKDFIKRRALPLVTLLSGLIALILLLLLSTATSNTDFFDQYFIWLYAANIVVGILLLLTIIILVVVISIRWRKGRFGTRLIAKLAMIFALVGVVPGVILYSVSWQFVSKSIETWFDVKVESALNSGLELGRVTLRIAQEEILAEGKFIAEQVIQVPPGTSSEQVGSMIVKIRNQFGIQEVSLFNMQRILILSTESRPKQFFPAPSAEVVEDAFKKNGITFLDEIELAKGQPGYRVRAIVPIVRQKAVPTKTGSTRYVDDKYFLQLVRFIPEPLAKNIYAVESAYSEYQEKALGRVGLRKMYIGTLTLTLFFALFVAVTLALLLGRQLAQPLLMLLRGTQAVAQGDLSPKPELDTGDELGMLTRQFNVMTKQLSDARDSLQESKSFLETVLGNLTAGVCIFDNNFNLASSNPGAAKILGRDLLAITGKPLTTIPELIEFDSAVREGFATQNLITSAKTGEVNKLEPVWQKQIQINPVNEYENDLGSTLFVRGTQLSTSLKMIVFDDISDVVAAQRSIAWSEVARRLAHEIKNPLTPIQLSAERLQQKLVGKLSPDQDEMLERSTNTIIGQVQAMKQMVNEFRDFAKTPSPTLGSLDLNILIQEVMGLYEGSNIEVRLDSRCPRVMGDPTQLRQVIHNLLQNAQDASLESHHAKQLIEISTELVEIHDADQNRAAVRMTISDSGPGFQAKILARAFEPYITTKAKGTGLGLAVVKKIIDDHGAKIEIRNRKQGDELLGAQVSILFINLARGAV
ncbi:MAG: HAMP domain-containing protein [Burkholderiaceae bacterium]|jgi:nitrogen fixation/metabolism regulation signal transduction histidine kinase|nr:HAMP domain-containing protein [Burkholderiaceae bacterium]NCX45536.1 HAMP domain-containing protein [Burkholderiaceae bacterium]NDC65473.1 HAMP domain-containing protein [Burkholderiaceae bacterium]NDI26088.1 HAMP domain-containing protein [Burkholderiaceae bacterium]